MQRVYDVTIRMSVLMLVATIHKSNDRNGDEHDDGDEHGDDCM